MLSDSIFYWLNTYHIDGFRYDATKHIPEVFWKKLTKKIKTNYIQEGKGNVFQIGDHGSPLWGKALWTVKYSFTLMYTMPL